jgi:hypothetical protein
MRRRFASLYVLAATALVLGATAVPATATMWTK